MTAAWWPRPSWDRVAGFDKARCALHGFRTEVWNGFVFVNLDGQAAPLASRLADLEPLIRNYHIDERNFLYSEDDLWSTNWKLLCENFMEGYHLSVTHSQTLHPITPTRLCEKIAGGPAFTGYKAHYNPNTPERGPFHPDLTREEQRFSGLYCIYPGLVFSVAPHFTLFVCLRPAGTDRVAIRWGVAGVLDRLRRSGSAGLRPAVQDVQRRRPSQAGDVVPGGSRRNTSRPDRSRPPPSKGPSGTSINI